MSVKGININVDVNWSKLSWDISQRFNLQVSEVDKFLVDHIQDYFVTKLNGTDNGVLRVDDFSISK